MAAFLESVPATLEGTDACRFLERVVGSADLAEARAALATPTDPEPLLSFLPLREDRPVQAVLHRAHGCALVLFGWLPGQTEWVQDEGGAESVYRVLRGAAIERRFRTEANGRTVETSCERYLAGSVVMCEGDEAHAIANDTGSPGPLYTLHVYRPSPPRHVGAAARGGVR